MKIQWTDRARADLDHVHRFIAADRPTAAQRVVEGIRSTAASLADFPLSGRKSSQGNTRERVVRRLPYVIVYEVDESRGEVVVLNVLHGAQRR